MFENSKKVICPAFMVMIFYNKTNYELAYRVEYIEDKIIVVMMAGTRENFYDKLKNT